MSDINKVQLDWGNKRPNDMEALIDSIRTLAAVNAINSIKNEEDINYIDETKKFNNYVDNVKKMKRLLFKS